MLKKQKGIIKELKYFYVLNKPSFMHLIYKMPNNFSIYNYGLFNIIEYKFKYLILKKADNLFIYKNQLFIFNNNIIFKSFINLINKFLYGNLFKYFIKLRLSGMGYKLTLNQTLQCIKFSLGFKNKVFDRFIKYNLSNILIFKKSFRGVSFILRTTYVNKLKLYANLICLLKKVDPYKNKGLYIEGTKLKKKSGKKKLFMF